ncbi:MAG: cytidine deaminase [Candidatus Sumerlaeota bacterium]|nr:cytidine deaminase [Candidatus Sumerlaeota bacterium]
MLHSETRTALLRRAAEVRRRAYAPYSGFRVGAALLAEDGRIFAGCNVENASYSLTVCAERNALFHAVAEGAARFQALAVAAECDSPAAPCGACRQALSEFAPDLEIVLGDAEGRERETLSLRDLLPRRFGPDSLPGRGQA